MIDTIAKALRDLTAAAGALPGSAGLNHDPQLQALRRAIDQAEKALRDLDELGERLTATDLELIADALDVVQPDTIRAQDRAERLAAMFRDPAGTCLVA